MQHRRHQNWEQRSPPPWTVSAPVSVETIIWTEVQDLREDFEAFQVEVREELGAIGAEVQSHSRLRHNAMRTVRFLWTDGGRILIFIGMLLFAVSGITGQLPKKLATMLGSFALEK